MRKKLIIATTAGVLTLGGLGVAVPALADTGDSSGSAVHRITEALSGLVSDGSITQEQADEVAGTLDEAGIGHGGGHRGGGLDLSAAATARTTRRPRPRRTDPATDAAPFLGGGAAAVRGPLVR